MFGFRKKHDERSVKEEPVVEEPETEEKGEETKSVEKDEPVAGKYSVEAVGKIVKFVLENRYDGVRLKDKTYDFKNDYVSPEFDFAVYILNKNDLTLRIAIETFYEKPCTQLRFDIVYGIDSNMMASHSPSIYISTQRILGCFNGHEAKLEVRSLETLPDDLIAVMEDGPYKDEGKVVGKYEQHGNITRSIRWKGRGLLDEPSDVKDADRVIEDLKNKGWRK